MTLKINRVPDSPKDYVCTKFSQNPLKDVDSRVFTRIVTDGRKDGSVTISPRNFVGEGIIISVPLFLYYNYIHSLFFMDRKKRNCVYKHLSDGVSLLY